MRCVWPVPHIIMFHGSLVQLSTMCVWLLLVRLAKLSTRCVWFVPYVRMLPASLVQFSTMCVWLVLVRLAKLSKRCVWLVPYVRMLPGSLVQLSTMCVRLYLLDWPSSLRGVFDLYLKLGCYPGPWSSSLQCVFDLYHMQEWFMCTCSNYLRLRGVYEL
jgi:hypothetical protein